MGEVTFVIQNQKCDFIEHLQAENFRQWKHKNALAAIVIHLRDDTYTLIEHVDDIPDLPPGVYQASLVKKCKHSERLDLWKHI